MFGVSKRCPSCDAKVSNKETICPKCGKSLDPAAAEQSATSEPVAPPAATASAPAGSASKVPIFDKREQLQKVESVLVPGETIEAVFDMKGGGTGFLGITDKRLVIYDKAFLRKWKAVVSIPYSRVYSVASKDEGGVFVRSSELVITTSGGEHEFEFWGSDKAHQAHQMVIRRMIG